MNYEIYTIRDGITNCFSDLRLYVNQNDAVRSFSAVCKQSPFGKDYDLYFCGTFNLSTGELSVKSVFDFVKHGSEVLSENLVSEV